MSELKAFTVETTIEPNCTCADCAEELHEYAAYDNHRCLRLCGACAVHILQARLDRVTELVEELGEALEDLLDHQNGCPLPKYEIPWNRAVESSRAALGHWRALKDGEK